MENKEEHTLVPGEEVADDEGSEVDPLSDPEERRVLFAALDSFRDTRQYRQAAHYNITHLRRQSFYSLPSAHMELLASESFNLPKTLDAVDAAIDANADIADTVLALGLDMYGLDPESTEWRGAATSQDMDKVRSTIRQLYRDWSAEGAREREACYRPILAGLNRAFEHVSPSKRSNVSVLVPGAGLGRLAFEICNAGYAMEGNEISYHQLLVSNWILNYTSGPKSRSIFPWALGFSNHTHRSHQLQEIQIPDVWPAEELDKSCKTLSSELHAYQRMSMSSGDFCVLYKEERYRAAFDAVTTCFFVDTAPNLIAYIETVKHCLKPGGVWINLGPLLWHFEGGSPEKQKISSSSETGRENQDRNQGIGESGSFELADEEVVKLVEYFGFEVIEHNPVHGEAGYIQDPRSMLQNTYKPSFWMARKM
ncbi:N2227-domain-containing protein [Aureobasidium subglaciale]|nr:N2227-domain-containing protein [Aureobasidium subglaciale]KAI5227568.1 N2227-domain-containing protein [Aureobasidium subglaciale]KAI5231053.1 N2227-domain-containing protein [Aureobasidium subglaciale]KAI5265114.1 N2227-domain-containing protein [Aureobasidium subglaciale]